MSDNPLWRARTAQPSREQRRLHDPFEEAKRFKQQERERQRASWKRIEQRQTELLKRTLDRFDDDAMRALIEYFETTSGAFGEISNLCNAARKRLADEVELEPSLNG